jgi:hypothetical protein
VPDHLPRDPPAREVIRYLRALLEEYYRVLVTPKAAARLLNVSRRFLASITMPRGDLACLRLPGRGKLRTIRYLTSDLLEWAKNTRDAQSRNGRGGPKSDDGLVTRKRETPGRARRPLAR